MRWVLKTADAASVQTFAATLSAQTSLALKDPQLAATLAGLLLTRGISEAGAAEHFLAPALVHLHSPYLMTGVETAIDRIDAAIENKESILIYGDYDVDGTTAIVILKTAIELCGGTADFHVPHRIRDGYDMRDDVIERAGASKSQLYHYFADRGALLRAVVAHNAHGVLSDLPPLDGRLTFGHAAQIGYLAQLRSAAIAGATVLGTGEIVLIINPVQLAQRTDVAERRTGAVGVRRRPDLCARTQQRSGGVLAS